MLCFFLISLSTLAQGTRHLSEDQLINIQSFMSSKQVLIKLMISLILLPLPGALLCLKHRCHGHRPLSRRTADKEGSPSLGLLYKPLLQESTNPRSAELPRVHLSQGKTAQKATFNQLRLIWLVFTVQRKELSPQGEVEKKNTHLGTVLFFFLPDAITYPWCF